MIDDLFLKAFLRDPGWDTFKEKEMERREEKDIGLNIIIPGIKITRRRVSSSSWH